MRGVGHVTRRGVLVAIPLAALVAVAVLTVATPSERVYSVAEVRHGLAVAPRRWVNRTVLVRGVFIASMSDPGVVDIFHPPPYILMTYDLYQPGPLRTGGISGLPLVLTLAPHLAAPRVSPLADLERRLPWLGHLLGDAGAPIFEVTLLAPRRGGCAVQACPDGQLDARPW